MAKKEKAAKPAKVKAKKKPQFNAEQGGIGKIFQKHGEKMAFGVVVLATGALVYLGWSASTTLSPDLTRQSPKKIRDLAQQARSNIEKTTPDIVEPPPPLTGILTNVSSNGIEKSELLYPYPKPTPRTIKPRKDPKLFPPIKPEVTPVTGPIAKKKENIDRKDRIALLKAWAERQAGEGSTGPGGPGGPGGIGGVGGPGSGSGKSSGPGGPGGASGGGGVGMGGPGGMMGGSGGGNLVGLLDDGYQPIGGDSVMPETAHGLVVKFLVPNELQVQEYKNNFDGTDEQSQPIVLGMQIQRAIVNGLNDADLKWELIASNMDLTVNELEKKYNWEGVGPIVADPSVLHENLTMPMPPFISRNFYDISLHSETPKGKAILSEPEKPKEEEDKGTKQRKPGEFRIDPSANAGPGMMAGGPPGVGGVRPGGGGSPYGGGRPGGGRPGGGDGDDGLASGGGGGMGMGAPGGMGMGSPRGMGGFGMGGGGSFGASAGVSKYYLLRFCDVDVEPGKFYRYRVRVIYEDPNKPQFETFGTRPAAMDESVLDRLQKEQQEREKEGEKGPYHLRFTDWSEPTPASKVNDGNYAFAGPSSKAYGGAVQRIPGQRIRFFGIEPAVQMIPVVYESSLGCDVYPSAPVDASRGVVLDVDNGSSNTKRKVIHPVSREAKELTEYPSNTGITVVDILGGETIATKTGDIEALLAPLDVMLVDNSGKVVIRTDMKDDQDFHKFVEREEEKKRSDPGGGIGGVGGYGGRGGGSGGEGGGGPPGNKGGGGPPGKK